MYLLAAMPHTAIVTININVTLATRHNFDLLFCFLSAFSLSTITRAPLARLSIFESTLVSGVPSLRQNAAEAPS